MTFAGIHHVAISVDDVDGAIAFYTQVLGCTVRDDRPDFGFPGAWLDAGAHQIHLMEFGSGVRNLGHFALQVDSAETWHERLTGLGVEHVVATYSPGAGHQVFLHDPAGNQIELNEPDH